jgi:hypothetical protein
MEPPIQTEYLRSGGAMILTFMVDGARRTPHLGKTACKQAARVCNCLDCLRLPLHLVSCGPGHIVLLGSGCGQGSESAVAAVCRTHVEAVLSALQLPITFGDFLNHRTLHRQACERISMCPYVSLFVHRTTWHTPILQRHGPRGVNLHLARLRT